MNSTDSNEMKAIAHRLVDSLPDEATWDDLMERFYVRQAIEAGLRDLTQGRVAAAAEVRRQFGLVE
jgi:hypothetical protein